MSASNTLKAGSNGFTDEQWFIGYHVGTDYGAGIKIWHTNELFVVNISKDKYCVNRSRDISYDHFSKNLKIVKTGGGFKKRSQVVSTFSFILIDFYHFTFGMTVYCNSIKKNWANTSF